MMHPDAFDHSTLSVWAAAKSHNDFLFLENLPKDKAYHGPFVLPSNRMMLDFCRDLVKLGGLDKRIWPAHAESMRPSACGSGIEVSLRTAEDTLQTVLANHVVVARGPTWRRQWPAFYKLLDAAALAEIRHTWDLFDKPEQVAALRGRGIIVGGGLSSAHLCTQLAGRGHIDLLIRRERKVKQYDLGLSWMGWKRREQRREYEQASIEERLANNRAARDGGSVSPALDVEVSQLEAKGLVTVHEWTEIATASFDGSWTVALSTGDVMEADYLICATGALVDAATDPLLSGLQEVHPLPMHGGLPAVTYNLQWGKLPVSLGQLSERTGLHRTSRNNKPKHRDSDRYTHGYFCNVGRAAEVPDGQPRGAGTGARRSQHDWRSSWSPPDQWSHGFHHSGGRDRGDGAKRVKATKCVPCEPKAILPVRGEHCTYLTYLANPLRLRSEDAGFEVIP